jgi:hypothetical protein
LGQGISITIEESNEIADAVLAALGDDLALVALAADILTVTLSVSFGDGSGPYVYDDVDLITATTVMSDHSQYNRLLRQGGGGSRGSRRR